MPEYTPNVSDYLASLEATIKSVVEEINRRDGQKCYVTRFREGLPPVGPFSNVEVDVLKSYQKWLEQIYVSAVSMRLRGRSEHEIAEVLHLQNRFFDFETQNDVGDGKVHAILQDCMKEALVEDELETADPITGPSPMYTTMQTVARWAVWIVVAGLALALLLV